MSAYVTFLTWTKLVLVVVALSAVSTSVQSCSPIPNTDYDTNPSYKGQHSDIILTAKVITTRPDTRFPGHNVYSADLEVKCIYKGGPLNEHITVAEAGTVPGLCLSTNLTVSQSYILFLRSDGDLFKQQFSPEPDDEQYIDEITAVCGLYLHYPTGYDTSNKKYECTDLVSDETDDCIGATTTTTTTTKPGLVTKESEEKYMPKPEPESNDGASYVEVKGKPDDENSGQTLFLCWSSIISLIGAMFLL